MNRSIIIVGILLYGISTGLFAQQWTDEEQELLDQLELNWNAWMEAVKKNDPEIFFDKARPAEDSLMWWTEHGAPQGNDAVRRDWDSIRSVDSTWIDIRPVAIRIYGDVGIIHFYGYWKAKTKDGPVTTEYKRTQVFIKRDGRWMGVGGQGTPASSRDAESYE